MTDSALVFLQILMLVTDGTGIFASFTVAQYYRLGKKDEAVSIIYYFFLVITLVFVYLTISDAMVIAQAPLNWAMLPIVRGLGARLPITIAELWMIHKQHVR